MNISGLSESNYLKKEDVMPPITVTISGLEQKNMAKEGEPVENKYILTWMENIKPMVLNMTNGQLIAHVLGSEETDDWRGKQITLYNDPSVSFGGKLTGGIRVQIPAGNPAPVQQGYAPANDPAPTGPLNDDLPPF